MSNYMIIALVAIGLYMLNKQTTAPVFVDANGNALGSNIPIGTAVSLTVPGYTQVWLQQTKNGVQNYNGIMAVPEQPYTTQSVDAGVYVNNIYTVNAAGTGPDTLIASITANIG